MFGLNRESELKVEIATRVVGTLIPLTFVALAICTVAVYLAGAEHQMRFVSLASGVVCMLLVLVVFRSGRVLLAGHLIVTLSGVAAVIAMLLNGGVLAPGYTSFLVLMAIAAWLYGLRVAVLFWATTAAIGGAFVWLELAGLLRPAPMPTPLMTWLLIIGFQLLLLGATAIPNRMLHQALTDSEERRIEAEQANRALAERERALRESEERYRLLLDSASDAIFVHGYRKDDPSGPFTEVNDVACRLLGYSRQQLLAMSTRDISVGSSAEPLDIRRRLLKDRRVVFETTLVNSEKQEVQLEMSSHLFQLQGEETILSIGRDISERRRAEQALREREEILRSLVETSQDWIWSTDAEGRHTYCNPAIEKILGYPPERFLERPALDFMHEEDRELLRDKLGQWIEQGSGWRNELIRWRHRDGSVRYLESSAVPIMGEDGQLQGFRGIDRDITERLQTEQALRESEERFRTLVANIPGVSYRCICNQDWTMEYISDEVETLTGYRPSDFLGNQVRSYASVIHPDDRQMVQSVVTDGVRKREPFAMEYRIVRADEQVRWVYERGQGVFDNHGEVRWLDGVTVDVTDRKRGEAERERLLSAIEQSGEVIFITDVSGAIQYVNPAFERTTGYSREEALGQNPRILKSGEQDREFYSKLWQTITSGKTWQGRFINRRKDGTHYNEEATISPVCDEAGNIVSYVAVKSDVTQILALEEQYRQAQKMEAIGQLTGGVAHDFNNLLQAIIGYNSLALVDLGEQHPVHEILTEVDAAGKRAATLVGQLLAFSRRQIMRPENLDLNEVVSGLLKMLKRVIGEHIRIELVQGHHLGKVHADRGMVEQVVMNLCVNARDAMSEGGTLSIETQNVLVDTDYCASHPWAKPGRYLLLSVTDAGCGMDRNTIEHIFEPFFTTKEEGRGTGLGLATVYGIVKQHEGMITAYSEPGKGSTFKVYLPLCELKAESVGSMIEGAAVGGTETILLAEDDELVRDLAMMILERGGYAVLTASNGSEAMELFEKRGEEIDMALLDVVMPGMGGREVREQMIAVRPDIRVLFTSGYTENAVHTNFVLDHGLTLIQKPYSTDALLRAVRTVLDQT
jgi:PAS domain S-box-containing protein